ncbi:MAG TPA: hypothetical protein VK206_02730 [Anaerolineales bacterium]|nr:hypothetical protein [Anaerolineales bacterium]
MKKRFKEFIQRVIGLPEMIDYMKKTRLGAEEDARYTRLLVGKMLANQVKQHGIYQNLYDAEFKVFSQFGDDGILQYLICQTCPEKHIFIEFGVQNYEESNTRFLLLNDNWRGLIMDGSMQAMSALRHDEIYWRHDLTAAGAFITRENVNQLFLDNGFSGEIGLLSIDIDGNDYWVWEAIDCVTPVIVTVEYNSVFGVGHAITIPYDPAFHRTSAHYSNLYWGASLKAFCLLAEKKGYVFVGCNSNGNNAHFIRKDKVGNIPIKTVEQGYVGSQFRESRDQSGNLTFLSGKQRIEAIKDQQVIDVENNRLAYLRDFIEIR